MLTQSDLRDCLHAAASAPRIAAAVASGALARLLRAVITPHVLDVYARVERVAADDVPEAWQLKLVALVHEEAPHDLPSMLADAGFADVAPFVTAIVRGFGEVWQASGERALRGVIARHRPHLGPLLLFELAHEGAATRAMRTAAYLAGERDAFARWEARLR